MIPWVLLDSAKIPGSNELRLWQRGEEFSIRLGRDELMNSRVHGSEEELATLACERVGDRAVPTLLIGGLGMGFTLRAALDALKAESKIVVAELMPAVIAWNKGPLARLTGNSLEDPRVRLVEGDVGETIRAQADAYDAILLDVDNGPEGLTRAANDGLYDLDGLAAARTALKANGVLLVWSAGEDQKFTQRLRRSGFEVEVVRTRARGARGGAKHVIWMATRVG